MEIIPKTDEAQVTQTSERLPLKSQELKDVLNSGHNVWDVLQTFVHDQRQVLRVWKNDLTAQVREHLAEKYPGLEMNIVAESFEIKMARAIEEPIFHSSCSCLG